MAAAARADWHLPPIRRRSDSASSSSSSASSMSSVRDFRRAVAADTGRTGIRRVQRRRHAARRSDSRSSARSVHSHISDFIGIPFGGKDPDGFMQKSRDEDCIKCMLRVPHDKCESHRYIRVGGGYRHSFWYIKILQAEIELARQQAIIRQRRLETINEGNVRAVKTFIRTKSGRVVEKVVFMSEDDYNNFQKFIKDGGDPSTIVRKYLNKDEAENLQSFEKEEQKALKTTIRTKSGRIIERIVYVSKSDHEKIAKGEMDANQVLRRQLKPGERLESWSNPKMRTITTEVRTKSGRIIKKQIQISEDDYQKLKTGKADVSKVLGKYISKDEGQVQGWQPPKKEAMKVVKTFIRTKSGRVIEKEVMMTEEEFKEFQESGGDPEVLRRYIKLKDGEKIDKWEKASTVYADSDDGAPGPPKKAGDRVVDKDGNVYEYVKDPLTGKMFKKQVNKNGPKGAHRTKDGKIITAADIKKRQEFKQGKRNTDSDSDFSYKSEVSEGGTRHVFRRAKNADGTYGDRESYHSSEDEEGQKRRRQRRRQRQHGSAVSIHSEVSEGGTRRVFVRERRPDGTYGEAKEYHSDDSEEFAKAKKIISQQQRKAKERQHGSDSEHSYASEYSDGGTRTRKRRQKIRDEFGNVIGYGKEEKYDSPIASDDDAVGGQGGGRGKKGRRAVKGKRGEDYVGGSDSDFSYHSEVSDGGTKRVVRREKIRDAEGNVIGYGKKEEYKGKLPVKARADAKKKKREADPDQYEYYSEESDGGTKRTMRRKIYRDEHGNVVGHGEQEVYDSDDAETFVTVSDGKGGRVRKLNPAKAANREKIRAEDQKQMAKKKKGKTVRLADGREVQLSSESEVFSDASTDSDAVAEKLEKMTAEEKKKYLAERSMRKKEREQRRRDKYGDDYEKMVEKKEKKKEERRKKIEEIEQQMEQMRMEEEKKKSPAKSMVSYEKSGPRFKDQKMDERPIGLGHDDWGKPSGRRRAKDGNEADSESDEAVGQDGRRRKGKRHSSSAGSDTGSDVQVIRDKDGKVIKKIKTDKDGNVVEYEYDERGNLKSKVKKTADEADQGDYFETTSDGKLRLKKGKKRLDLDKISREELEALGIDPNSSKADILRQLKQKLGDDVDIHFKGNKIGAKHIDEYSDIDSDKLADDDDLDTETLTGIKRMRVIMKKGGRKLIDHMQGLIDKSLLNDNATEEEKASEVDFLSAYRLVDPAKLETYGKAFVVEDFDDMDGLINYRSAKRAIGMVPSVSGLSDRQINYALQALGFDHSTHITFRMFSVAMALCERVTKMDQYCRDLLEITNLIDIERKLALYRAMFYCNAPSDRDANFIKLDSLRIELMAGGLNWKQQEFIIEKLQPNEMFEISFLDYLCYIPLFLSFHDNILNNPLDTSDLKYTPTYRRRASAQRDMNPLAYPLRKGTMFMQKNAGSLLEGQPLDANVKKENEKNLRAFDRKDGSLSFPASAKKKEPKQQ